jgi:hypothetical protein
MDPEKHRRIAQRAYALWEAEGAPVGTHEENWHRAEREIEAEEAAHLTVNRAPRRQSRAVPASPPRQRRKAAKA